MAAAGCDIIIRMDANHSKGMGHLYRMLQVAEALTQSGWSVSFSGRMNAVSQQMLTKKQYRFMVFDENASEEVVIEKTFTELNDPCLWIYDVLDTQTAWIRIIQQRGVRVMCLDDCGAGPAQADEVILTLPCKFMNLEPSVVTPRIRYGIQYMILPAGLERYSSQRSFQDKTCFRIGVSMGGSDTHGSTFRMAEALNAIAGNIDVVDFYTGPSFEHSCELEAAVYQAAYPGVIHKNVPDLHQQLNRLDVVITGGGMTLFEAARMGLPVLAFANELFEKDNIQYLADRGGCRKLGCIHETSCLALSEKLRQSMAECRSFAAMAQKGSSLLKQSGTASVIGRIEEHITCKV